MTAIHILGVRGGAGLAGPRAAPAAHPDYSDHVERSDDRRDGATRYTRCEDEDAVEQHDTGTRQWQPSA